MGKRKPLRQELINARCKTADEVANWILNIKKRYKCSGHTVSTKPLTTSMQYISSIPNSNLNAEISANAIRAVLSSKSIPSWNVHGVCLK